MSNFNWPRIYKMVGSNILVRKHDVSINVGQTTKGASAQASDHGSILSYGKINNIYYSAFLRLYYLITLNSRQSLVINKFTMLAFN